MYLASTCHLLYVVGHRFRTTHDFGYVALDVLYTYAEDSGNYLCKATNKVGEAVNSCNVKVAGKSCSCRDLGK